MEKLKRTFSLEAVTVKQLEAMAESEKRNLSTIIDMAIQKVYSGKSS